MEYVDRLSLRAAEIAHDRLTFDEVLAHFGLTEAELDR
jgi:hypothetical protein